jgi:malate dehydrogenase (oxaloacetate-decarboxylating)(NADP+)
VVFAEAENEIVLRAAIQFRDFGYGEPVLVGRTAGCARQVCASWASPIRTASRSTTASTRRWYRRWSTCSTPGFSVAAICAATCERMVNQDRNVFGSLLLKLGDRRCNDHRHDPHLARPCVKCAACSIPSAGPLPISAST